jgi:death-on-curing family protein
MKYISAKEVEYVAHSLAQKLLEWNEPIPGFETRYPNKLESCLATPQQKYAKKELYPGLIKKAAVLFYLMIKNHPFQNGNKRTAVMTLLYFLLKNGKWMKLTNQELYNFAKWVAESDRKLKEETIKATETYIKIHLTNLDVLKKNN